MGCMRVPQGGSIMFVCGSGIRSRNEKLTKHELGELLDRIERLEHRLARLMALWSETGIRVARTSKGNALSWRSTRRRGQVWSGRRRSPREDKRWRYCACSGCAC